MKGRHSAAALVVLFLLLASTSAAALSIPWETRTGQNRSGSVAWTHSYDIGLVDDVLMIDVDIALTGIKQRRSLRDRWESGIEDLWSTDRFSVPILFNVDWVKLNWVKPNYDHLVTVRRGPGNWNLRTWYTGNPSGWGSSYHEEIAAHEFGHMIGLFDEYEGSPLDPSTARVNTGGLMDTLDGSTLDHYYEAFLEWYDERLAALVAEPALVSDPATSPLFAAGFIALLLLGASGIHEPAGSAPRTSRPIGANACGNCV
jgi:hypothetical protein